MHTFQKAILILALTLPTGVSAQSAPDAPSANPITDVFRARTMTLQRQLAQAFDSIPESLFGYKPTPVQLTIGYVAQHLASDNYFFCNNFGAMKATISAKDSATADTVKAKWSKGELVSKMKESFTFCEKAFEQLNDAALAGMVTVPSGPTTTRSIPRTSMVLGHALDIEDHYSQIANYMRLNNLIPPSALPRPRPPAK